MDDNDVELDDPQLRAHLQHFHQTELPSEAERAADLEAVRDRLGDKRRVIGALSLVCASALAASLLVWAWPRESAPSPRVPRASTLHISLTFHQDPARLPVNITLRAHD